MDITNIERISSESSWSTGKGRDSHFVKGTARGFFYSYLSGFRFLISWIDILLLVVSAGLVYWLRFDTLSFSVTAICLILLQIVLMQGFFSLFGVYSGWPNHSICLEIRSVVLAWVMIVVSLALIGYATKTGASVSRLWAFSSSLLSLTFMLLARGLYRYLFKKFKSVGSKHINAVIVGDADRAGIIAQKLKQAPWFGVYLLGMYQDKPGANKSIQTNNEVEVLGDIQSLIETIQRGNANIDQVWIALPLAASERIKYLLQSLEDYPVQVHYMPDINDMIFFNASADVLGGIPIGNMVSTPIVGLSAVAKNILDKIFAISALIMLSPLMLLIALIIRLSSKGPVVFKQTRYGIDGKEFDIYKFRTMQICEGDDKLKQATKNDPRVTSVGKYLRAWSLDELPQFFNVLQGNMSVVGPRPHAVAHNEIYRNEISKYMQRHMVKPGITGLAQIKGYRGETNTQDKMEKRVQYDLEYIQRWNLFLDAYILFMTVFKGFHSKNAY